VVGDQTYGGRLRLPAGASEALNAGLRQFKRQALHAAQLEFEHPRDREQLSFNAEMPQDMRDLVELLR
jgi:23S rRNA pseudouridine1911/1915/1917 synthase